MTDNHTFKISEAFYPSVYEGFQFHGDDKPTFGVTIKAEELPESLRPYARAPRDKMGHNLITISAGKIAPIITTQDNRHGMSEVVSIMRFADDANIPRDHLLRGVPMELATQIIEFDASDREPGRSVLFLKALKVSHTDLLRRYDECCAQFFTGA